MLIPAVSVADRDHGGQNATPSRGIHHGVVRKHTAIPAYVRDGPCQVAVVVAQPHPGRAWHVELALGIIRQAVPSSLVVRACTLHRR